MFEIRFLKKNLTFVVLEVNDTWQKCICPLHRVIFVLLYLYLFYPMYD